MPYNLLKIQDPRNPAINYIRVNSLAAVRGQGILQVGAGRTNIPHRHAA